MAQNVTPIVYRRSKFSIQIENQLWIYWGIYRYGWQNVIHGCANIKEYNIYSSELIIFLFYSFYYDSLSFSYFIVLFCHNTHFKKPLCKRIEYILNIIQLTIANVSHITYSLRIEVHRKMLFKRTNTIYNNTAYLNI